MFRSTMQKLHFVRQTHLYDLTSLSKHQPWYHFRHFIKFSSGPRSLQRVYDLHLFRAFSPVPTSRIFQIQKLLRTFPNAAELCRFGRRALATKTMFRALLFYFFGMTLTQKPRWRPTDRRSLPIHRWGTCRTEKCVQEEAAADKWSSGGEDSAELQTILSGEVPLHEVATQVAVGGLSRELRGTDLAMMSGGLGRCRVELVVETFELDQYWWRMGGGRGARFCDLQEGLNFQLDPWTHTADQLHRIIPPCASQRRLHNARRRGFSARLQKRGTANVKFTLYFHFQPSRLSARARS